MLKKLFFTLVTLSTALSLNAGNLPDLLDMPAEHSPRNIKSMYLDIAKAGDRAVAVGEYGKILYSDDAGRSWRQADVPLQSALTAVFFVDDKHGWAVGHDGVILHSSDSGESWTTQLTGRETGEKLLNNANAEIAKLEQAIAELQAAGESTADLELQLDNAYMAQGEAENESSEGPNRPFLDVLFKNTQHGFAVGAFGYFFETKDGGKTWQDKSLSVPNSEFMHLYSIAQISDQVLIAVGEFGMVLRSEDGGSSWQRVEFGYDGTLFTVSKGADEGDAVITGLRGSFFHSQDAGLNWQQLSVPLETSLVGAYSNGKKDVFAVGMSATLIKANLNNGEVKVIALSTRSDLAGVLEVDGNILISGKQGLLLVEPNGNVAQAEYVVEASE
jgi:photosystem II stability/assembly factor-like uncharacterized protein